MRIKSMSSLLAAIFVFSLLMTACGAASTPVGAFRAKLPVNDGLGVDAGYYRVSLMEDGKYSIDFAQLESVEGMVGVNGHYLLEGDQITFTDEEGFAACTVEEGVSGTYKWSLANDELTLTPLEDGCQARVYVFTTKPLPREE